jgi:sialate O-acetylesterase
MSRLSPLLVAFLALAAALPAAAQSGGPPDSLRLPRLFADGMVLQRGQAIPVWGWAPAGTEVRVSLDGRVRRATAGDAGRWEVSFPALSAGGPHELAVEGGGRSVAIHDVLVGDVWVASGQSNMEFALSGARNAAAAIAAAHDPMLRELTVPHSWSVTPQDTLAGGSWERADPQHAGQFSAVAYFFARKLRAAERVPIGIIHTSWGGANVETWESQRQLGVGDSAVRAVLAREEARAGAVTDSLRARLGNVPAVDPGLVDGRAPWADPSLDDSGWMPLKVPGLWEEQGLPGLDGIAWYRTAVDLTAEEARQGARLTLGMIDDDDIAWVNGTEVGRTVGYNVRRSYEVPASALREGRNVIAVRVVDGGGGGGPYGDPAELALTAGSVRHPLAGTWRFRVGAIGSAQLDGQVINKIPSVLYNSMIHPLLDYPIRGVIWYQGESNANGDAQAAAYRDLFAGLIRSWRREWRTGQGAFPFLWVQLPNYGAVDSVPPARAAWATLRESQTAALSLPRTGQAVIIEAGEAGNLHPTDKQTVGERLALVAQKVAYGEPIEASGPTYRSHAIRDGKVILYFDHVDGGLTSPAPGRALHGFAIAGADRHWVKAEATIEGDNVVVWSPEVPDPVAVRYAWSNSPDDPTLYNRVPLPARPFRTDDW